MKGFKYITTLITVGVLSSSLSLASLLPHSYKGGMGYTPTGPLKRYLLEISRKIEKDFESVAEKAVDILAHEGIDEYDVEYALSPNWSGSQGDRFVSILKEVGFEEILQEIKNEKTQAAQQSRRKRAEDILRGTSTCNEHAQDETSARKPKPGKSRRAPKETKKFAISFPKLEEGSLVELVSKQSTQNILKNSEDNSIVFQTTYLQIEGNDSPVIEAILEQENQIEAEHKRVLREYLRTRSFKKLDSVPAKKRSAQKTAYQRRLKDAEITSNLDRGDETLSQRFSTSGDLMYNFLNTGFGIQKQSTKQQKNFARRVQNLLKRVASAMELYDGRYAIVQSEVSDFQIISGEDSTAKLISIVNLDSLEMLNIYLTR
ncbi:MAG: hypothetical protein AB7F43_08640 [Bacteriovoracia bacterium]